MKMTKKEKKAFANAYSTAFGLFNQSEVMDVLDGYIDANMDELEMIEQFGDVIPIIDALILWNSATKYEMERQHAKIDIQPPKVSKTVTTTTWYGDLKEVTI